MAETMLRLIERGGLEPFSTFHMDGHWDHDGRQMGQAVVRALGAPATPIKPLPWWALKIGAPFSTTPRELMEMRYLWNTPVRLANDRLRAWLGEEPKTPLDRAVFETLVASGCISGGAQHGNG